ncbi:translocation/assembly module TamB domain-containing protein [Frigidibacter sp. ROC022]|uniref:translocation/assembly module TamB domain-containing protein n=1 Tax=Frigidibacter sp. ROC022 TaxID=2971796 RepID=UPI00215B4DA7|nr:translocation/assembly module TamB domain-containing protein [Frigidibacter sp. ROC022]MCR8722847.1 translocation/assembly module TamB domain-containing protein [Frigidibacter sp. ROC022]
MRVLALILTVLTLALPPAAQAQDDDKGYLTRLIESNLSSDGQTVTLDGFEGALSSSARFSRLTIADDKGVWLTVEGAELDWSRSALLRGRLEVETLSADLIDLERLPPSQGGGGGLPSPTSAVVQLPSLPVSVHIGKIATQRLRLGPLVLGEEVVARLSGRLDLADGAGETAFSLVRIDGETGRLVLDAAFSNQTRQLKIALDLTEAEGGILAGLMGLPDRPALEFRIAGDAPVSDFRADIRLETGGRPRLTGALTLNDLPDGAGLGYGLDLGGDVAPLFAEQYRSFFGTGADLKLGGELLADGRVTVERLDVQSAELALAGSLAIGADGLPERFDLNGRLKPSDGQAVLLPLPGVETRISGGDIEAAYDSEKGDGFRISTRFQGFERDGVRAASGELSAEGTISRGASPGIEARIATRVAGLALPEPELASAIGPEVSGSMTLVWTRGATFELRDADLSAGQARFRGLARFSGLDGNLRITTTSTISAEDLAPYSGLAAQPLSGAARASVDGWYEPLGGAFDLSLDAVTTGLGIGPGLAGELIGGNGSFKGRVARGPEGTRFDDLHVATPQLTAALTGLLGADSADLELDATLADAAIVVPGLDGPLTAKGTLGRAGTDYLLDLSGKGPGGVTLAAKGRAAVDVSTLDVQIDGGIDDISVLVPQLSGPVTARGRVALDGQALTLDLATEGPGDVALQVAGGYALDAGTANLTLNGGADLALGNRFAPGKVDLGGRAVLDLVLAGTPGLDALSGTISASGARVALPGAGITLPDTDLEIALDPLHPARPEALFAATVTAEARGIAAPGQVWAPLIDGPLQMRGALALMPGGTLTLRDMALINGDARIAGKADLTGLGGDPAASADLRIGLDALARLEPLTKLPLAGSAEAEVGLSWAGDSGDVSAEVSGTTEGLILGAGPVFDLVSGNTALAARLRLSGDRLSLRDVDLRNGDARITGTADLAGLGGDLTARGDLVLTLDALSRFATIARLPLSGTARAEVSASYAAASGALSADISGTASNLSAGSGPAYDLLAGDASFGGRLRLDQGALRVEGGRFRNPALELNADYAPGAITLDARLDSLGRFVQQLPGAVTVAGTIGLGDGYAVDLTLGGPAAISARVGGSISAGLVPDLTISGSVPLGIANAFLPSAVDVQGQMSADLTLRDSLGLGGLGGTVVVSGGRASVPAVGLALEGLEARIGLAAGQAQVQAATGFSTGGRATVEGSVGLASPFGIDLAVALTDVGAVKEPTFRTTLGGQLTLGGSLVGGGLLQGRIDLGPTEVNLSFDGASGTLIDIDHQGEPAAVRETRRRAGLLGQGAEQPGGGQLALDLTVSAPNRVFIRGRGLDAELGGELNLTGRAGNVIPIGSFELVRGRLDILGKRLELTEASASLQGTFDPTVRLVATTTVEDVQVQIITEGTATAPTVTLQSSPDLPEDEILALLLFGKGLDKISPLQAVQLANAVRTLIGTGGEGVQGRIRERFGLDDLDVTTDSDGNLALKAGKYISENVYTDVQVNSQGEAEIQLNLDITPNLTGRGKVGSDGDSSLGLFFEKDY